MNSKLELKAIDLRDRLSETQKEVLCEDLSIKIQAQIIKLMILAGTIDSAEEYVENYAEVFTLMIEGVLQNPNLLERAMEDYNKLINKL